MAIERRIINKCTLVKNKDADRYTLGPQTFEFYYYNKLVCYTEFTSNIPVILKIQDPWSLVRHSNGNQTLARFNRIEDEYHGVDLIDDDYIIALYNEYEVNRIIKFKQETMTSLKPGQMFTADMFANQFDRQSKDIRDSMLKDMLTNISATRDL